MGDLEKISEVLLAASVQVNEAVEFDGWDGGRHGHQIILRVPDDMFGYIPLDRQWDIEQRIARDLNTASSGVSDEYISGVSFEHLEDAVAGETTEAESPAFELEVPRIWKPKTLRLFISHRDTDKVHAHKIARALSSYAVSSFVAHDSIEPDEDWEMEIRRALETMHAMLAVITDDFFSSAWTNQEIGFALAKGIPVLSLKVGSKDPIGFVRNKQAIKANLSDISSCASLINDTLKKRFVNNPTYRQNTINRLGTAPSYIDAADAFEEVKKLGVLTFKEVQALVEFFNSNSQLNGCFKLNNGSFVKHLNEQTEAEYTMDRGRIRRLDGN